MPLIQRLFLVAQSSVLVCMLAIVGIAQVHAAKPGPLGCSISPPDGSVEAGVPIRFTGNTTGGKGSKSYSWDFSDGGGVPQTSADNSEDVIYPDVGGPFNVLLDVTDKQGATAQCETTVTVNDGSGSNNTPPDAVGDVYSAITGELLSVSAPGVLGNDLDDGQIAPLTAVLISGVSNGTLNLNPDGSFTYTSGPTFAGEDAFTYAANDGEFQTNALVTINVADIPPSPDIGLDVPQTDFKIMMNYELGMHCTGFEFAYCCVLPAYNSILAQIVKPQGTGSNKLAPLLLEGDPNEGLDALGRPTVVRDKELGVNGDFQKYVMRYWHDAQPRNNKNAAGQLLGKVQTSTLISAVEGNSLFAWNTVFDSADVVDGHLQYGSYNGSDDVLKGNNILGEAADNYQNAVWNHLYFYADLEGTTSGFCTAPSGPLPDTEDHVGNKCVIGQDCNTTGICEVPDQNGDDIICTGHNACGPGGQCIGFIDDGACDTSVASSREQDKVRLGVNGHVVYPPDCGAALHPMGPDTSVIDPATGLPQKDADGNLVTEPNDCGGFSNGNVLTFSGHTGTVVYTQMKLLENLPVMLTSPDIWEALGLPLTPFEDSIDFFADPGLVDEDSIRPFVAMKAQMYDYDPTAPGGAGHATLDSGGTPVIGFGTAPIDIPNCERCHSNGPNGTVINNSAAEGGGTLTVANSPNDKYADQWALVQAEYEFWNAYYDINTADGDSDWYSRLKSAAISMLYGHDMDHGTYFTSGGEPGGAGYPACGGGLDIDGNFDPTTIDVAACGDTPQNTRLGHEAVICQRCHADNVIAVVKSASKGGAVIPPITEAIHNNHAGNLFADGEGRDGGCQGCHPAHRSSGDMNGYPITLAGTNLYSGVGEDNRDANGGCFVGRDVHSNPGKDTDGAETPEHLNAVGQWLSTNVYSDQHAGGGDKGIWCTNCHNQLGQELWKAENMEDLVHGVGLNNPRGETSLEAVATAVGVSEEQAIAWLDPTNNDKWGTGLGDFTNAIWAPDPGLCDYVDTVVGGGTPSAAHDGNVVTLEVQFPADGGQCAPDYEDGPNLQAAFDCNTNVTLCGKADEDGDFSVHVLDFCTTGDCVAAADAALMQCQTGADAGKTCSSSDDCAGGVACEKNSVAFAVPFSAATDGRDHWLSAGEPHCADCHAAPYVEQSGNINAYPPFNYPRKASLMRYSRGHQDITCQGCHESIHGLYPVTPNIDTTSYAQAASLNHDGSHGPLKCGACHSVGSDGIPSWVRGGLEYTDPNTGQRTRVAGNFDAAVSWMHTYTAEASPLERGGVCQNCHEDESDEVSYREEEWLEHAEKGRTSRQTMDKVEMELNNGKVFGSTNPLNTVCQGCHDDESDEVSCGDRDWKEHLTKGRVAESVWEDVSLTLTGSTCGW